MGRMLLLLSCGLLSFEEASTRIIVAGSPLECYQAHTSSPSSSRDIDNWPLGNNGTEKNDKENEAA